MHSQQHIVVGSQMGSGVVLSKSVLLSFVPALWKAGWQALADSMRVSLLRGSGDDCGEEVMPRKSSAWVKFIRVSHCVKDCVARIMCS